MPNQIWGEEAEASPCSALLVSADGSATNRVLELLTGGADGVAVEHVESLQAARERLAAHAFGVVLLDRLTFAEVCAAWPDPGTALRALPADPRPGAEPRRPAPVLEALRHGAHDCLGSRGVQRSGSWCAAWSTPSSASG